MESGRVSVMKLLRLLICVTVCIQPVNHLMQTWTAVWTLLLISSQTSATSRLQRKETFHRSDKMIFRGNFQAVASVLMIVMKVISADALECTQFEYRTGHGCCRMCPPGTLVKHDCTTDTPTSCQACIAGSYMDQPNGLKQCAVCSICDSGSGVSVKQPCTGTSDTVCEPAEGFFCIDATKSSCAAAQKHSSCKPGQYISKAGTSSSDTECSDCTHGTFSDGSSSSCREHTQCQSLNLQQIKAGTSSSDAECGENSSVAPAAGIGIGVGLLILLMVAAGVLYLFREKIMSLISGKQRNAEKAEKSSGGKEEPAVTPLNPDTDQDPEDVNNTSL